MEMSENRNPKLTQAQVEDRLDLCGENAEVIDELYEFGKLLLKESQDRISRVESKATSFAAYGVAVITLLVSTVSLWSPLGNRDTPLIACFAGLCGLVCAWFSIKALRTRPYGYISQEEWLSAECVRSEGDSAEGTGSQKNFLKKYRILTMWRSITSKDETQKEKAKHIGLAEMWLNGSASYLTVLLLNLAFVRSFVWLDSYWSPIAECLRDKGWKGLPHLADWLLFVALSLIFGWLLWRSRLRFRALL